jgi:ABC-type transporter Mla subunit MlaD
MADQAKVASIDAIDSLRVSITLFMERAGQALDEVGDAVRRTRTWLNDEQRTYWLSEKRKREKKLEQAEQELYSSRLSTLQTTSAEAQMHVRRARHALDEAEQKLRVLKKWARDYDSVVEPLARRLDTLRDLVMTKYPKAAAQLTQMINTLESYAELSAVQNPSPEGIEDPETPAT